MKQTGTVKASSLVLDYNLYPRHVISSVHVTGIVVAIEAGATLPPVVAERKTMRVVDGFHRVSAVLRAAGTAGDINVIWRDYDSEGDLLLDAIRLNAAHGRPFANYDRARCIVLAENLCLEKDKLAAALNMTVERLEALKLVKTAIAPDTHLTPIKATIAHLAQDVLSARQVEGNRKAGGMSAMFYVNQVINLVEADLLDVDNVAISERLVYLARLLERRLGVQA